MELPPDFSTFWSVVVLPNKPCKFTVPVNSFCSLTNAALDQPDDLPKEGRIVVSLSVNGGDSVCVVPFTIGCFESTALDLKFDGGSELVFTLKGPEVAVHLCGYLIDDTDVEMTEELVEEKTVSG